MKAAKRNGCFASVISVPGSFAPAVLFLFFFASQFCILSASGQSQSYLAPAVCRLHGLGEQTLQFTNLGQPPVEVCICI